MRRLLLHDSQRGKVALLGDHPLDALDAECSDQLLLQICDAYEEPQSPEIIRRQIGTKPGALEAPDEGPHLGRVAQPGNTDAETLRSEPAEEFADRARPTDRHDVDAASGEVTSHPNGQRLDRDLIARALDEDHCVCVGADRERPRRLGDEVLGIGRRRRLTDDVVHKVTLAPGVASARLILDRRASRRGEFVGCEDRRPDHAAGRPDAKRTVSYPRSTVAGMGTLLDHPQLLAFRRATKAADRDAIMAAAALARRTAEALCLAMIGFADATARYVDDAHRSAACWVTAVTNCSPDNGRRQVRQARMLRDLPPVASALLDGHIGSEQVAAFARLHRNTRVAPHLADAIDLLLEHAALLPYLDFVKVCQRFEAWADPDGAEGDHEQTRANRAMSFDSRGAGFRMVVRGDALTGSMIEAALEPFIEAEFEADWAEGREQFGDAMCAALMGRTVQQRRFDAFARLFAGDGVSRPTVNITVDHRTATELLRRLDDQYLRRDDATDDDITRAETADVEWLESIDENWTDRRCETTSGGFPVSSRDALTALMIGNVRKVVTDPRGETIHLGRRRRLFSGAARDDALAGGDRCVFVGCNIRGGRIEIDHTIAWGGSARGPTDQGNANIECPHHNLAKERLHQSVQRHPTMSSAWIHRRSDGTIIGPRTSPGETGLDQAASNSADDR